MNYVAADYKLPPEIMAFVENGFLIKTSEEKAQKTIRFDIPSLGTATAADDFTSYTLVWIHPDHNAEFCHYYIETPGDLPNFYVEIHSPNAPDQQVDGLDSIDDLVDWLTTMREDTAEAN